MKDKDEIKQIIEKVLSQHAEFASEDEAFAFVGQYVNQRNAQADPALGGLSPNQVDPLVNLPWDYPEHPMQLNEGLSLSVLNAVPFLINARRFLSDLMQETLPNVTATGNLNRRFVGQMLARLDLEPGLADQIQKVCKVINEPDVFPLHVLRLVCDVAGLIRVRSKGYRVVKKHQSLLQETCAGQLYARLFKAYFTQFNLGFCDSFPDCPAVQTCIPFTLVQLARRAARWQDLTAISHDLLLPMAREEMQQSHRSIYDDDLLFIELRVLTHLEIFGLIECERAQKEEYVTRVSRVRTTRLFDQFISFAW